MANSRRWRDFLMYFNSIKYEELQTLSAFELYIKIQRKIRDITIGHDIKDE